MVGDVEWRCGMIIEFDWLICIEIDESVLLLLLFEME